MTEEKEYVVSIHGTKSRHSEAFNKGEKKYLTTTLKRPPASVNYKTNLQTTNAQFLLDSLKTSFNMTMTNDHIKI